MNPFNPRSDVNAQGSRFALATLMIATLTACGGSLEESSGKQAERLTCATDCKPSSSLATNQIRASFAVVSDGNRVQAQAGFSTGSDLRFNVEIEGKDSLRLGTSLGTQKFYIPASGSLGALFADTFETLFFGANPYLADVPPAAITAPLSFQLVRGDIVHSASVQMPAPFQITSPANSAQLAIANPKLTVKLTNSVPAPSHNALFNCIDANGNVSSNQWKPLKVVPESVVAEGTGVSYTLNVGEAINTLSFTSTYPRGAVASCDLELNLLVETQGQTDPVFQSAKVIGQQIRKVKVNLR